MAGNQHRDPRGGAGNPAFQQRDLLGVEMVGRFIQEQGIRLPDPDAGEQRETLPAAAERAERTVVERVGGFELIEHGADAPGLVLAASYWEGAPQHFGERQAEQRWRHILFDVAQAGAP